MHSPAPAGTSTRATEAKPLRLLCVEDVEDDVFFIRRELKRHGYDPFILRVDCADDMRRALDEGHWDVIASDYHMPNFDTLSALEIRNAHDPDMPFIVVSGSIGEDAAVGAMKHGASDYVMKDNLTRLGPAVERELRESENRRAKRRADEDRARLIGELQKAVRIRDDFVVIASHELRTPLTALQLTMESAQRALRRTIGSENAMVTLERVQRQVVRLEELVHTLLDVSRLSDGGDLPIHPSMTDLSTAVRDAVEPFDIVASMSGGVLRVDLETPLVGLFDGHELKRVVTNLLSNAIKFGAGKPIAVSLRRDGDDAVFEVRDQGSGVPAADRERIFERFERGVSVSNFGGFGVGLWLSRLVVEAHGGTIALSSELGTGSTFLVRLPVRVEPAPEPRVAGT